MRREARRREAKASLSCSDEKGREYCSISYHGTKRDWNCDSPDLAERYSR